MTESRSLVTVPCICQIRSLSGTRNKLEDLQILWNRNSSFLNRPNGQILQELVARHRKLGSRAISKRLGKVDRMSIHSIAPILLPKQSLPRQCPKSFNCLVEKWGDSTLNRFLSIAIWSSKLFSQNLIQFWPPLTIQSVLHHWPLCSGKVKHRL